MRAAASESAEQTIEEMKRQGVFQDCEGDDGMYAAEAMRTLISIMRSGYNLRLRLACPIHHGSVDFEV